MSETPTTDKATRDLQSEIARVIPEPRNLVTRLEYARRVLAIPKIKEGQELLEKAKTGVLVELAEDQSWPRDPFYPIKNYNQLCENIGFRRVKVKGE